MDKKGITQMKAYFLIINLVIAILAFSWMVSATPNPAASPNPLGSLSKSAFAKGLFSIAVAFGLGYFIGGLIGDNADIALGSAFAGGMAAYELLISKSVGWGANAAFGAGLVVGEVIFLAMYRKQDIVKVEFKCLPWEAPIGGADCEKCNEFGECSEYRCKSLGQACELLNPGTEDEACTWVNPHDVNSPVIEMTEVLKDHVYLPDTSVRPPATGVVIRQAKDGPCIEPFTPLEFKITANEPAQCKIDYNLTRGFEEMNYYVGGSNLFDYNHTETMALPGPDDINQIAPELKNDGTYTLYVRCQDANGNFNQDPYSVRFCVKAGPDTTPPRIDDTSVPSDSAITFNQSTLNLEVYVNEPAECKWSKEDKAYSLMENQMACELNLWDMKQINNNWVYTCTTTLTGIRNREDNYFYFRCKDNPNLAEGDRYENQQSFRYNIVGTQPLTLLELKPGEGESIKGSTDTIPVFLEVKTDNGYRNGESICSYVESETTPADEDYIDFSETRASTHRQRQDLETGIYTYHIRCVDLGGNAVYETATFEVESDNNPPFVARTYKEAGQLRILTNEKSICSYSNKNCNFEIDEGLQMASVDNWAHATDWITNKNYYIRCEDEFGNQPGLSEGPEGCSIVVRPYEMFSREEVVEL